MRDFSCPKCGGKTFSASAELFLQSEADRYNSNSELKCLKCEHKGAAHKFVRTVEKRKKSDAE